MKRTYLLWAGRACIALGLILLGIGALYAGQAAPSHGGANAGTWRSRGLITIINNLVWLAGTDPQGGILVLTGGGLLLLGILLFLLGGGKEGS